MPSGNQVDDSTPMANGLADRLANGLADRGVPCLSKLTVECMGSVQVVAVEGKHITVGREPFDVEGQPAQHIDASADDTVSRRHAVITVTPDWACVTDLASTNGTRVNGVPIRPRMEMALADGDEILVGGHTHITCRAAAPAAERATPGPPASPDP